MPHGRLLRALTTSGGLNGSSPTQSRRMPLDTTGLRWSAGRRSPAATRLAFSPMCTSINSTGGQRARMTESYRVRVVVLLQEARRVIRIHHDAPLQHRSSATVNYATLRWHSNTDTSVIQRASVAVSVHDVPAIPLTPACRACLPCSCHSPGCQAF